MSLKSKITKAEFDILTADMQVHYKDVGNGNYVLETDQAAALSFERRAQQDRADNAERDLATLRAELETIKTERETERDELARKKNDIPTIEAAWQKKLDDAKKKFDDKIAQRENQLRTLLIRNEAIKIAHEVSTSPELLLPHIERALEADLEGETPKTIVLDATGKRTAKNLDEFRQDIVDNPIFADIIIGSRASGSGAAQNRSNPGGGAPGEILKMTLTERTALYNKVGEAEFNRRLADETARRH